MTTGIIYWENETTHMREVVVEVCGWRNKSGKATPMGKRIARTSWDKLSTAAKNVLLNHGIQEKAL